jgi:hypothetical protein
MMSAANGIGPMDGPNPLDLACAASRQLSGSLNGLAGCAQCDNALMVILAA